MELLRKFRGSGDFSPAGPERGAEGVKDFLPHVSTLSEKDRQAIAGWILEAQVLMRRFSSPSIERAIEKHLHNTGGDENSTSQSVLVAGAYLGNQLVLDFEMEWVLIRDENGRAEFAVKHGRHPLMILPFILAREGILRRNFKLSDQLYRGIVERLIGHASPPFVIYGGLASLV